MTTRQLRRLLPIWTSLLNINDWTIQVRWGTDEEMEGVVGLNFFSPEELQSEILLARGEGEETLIHELLTSSSTAIESSMVVTTNCTSGR